MAGPSSTQFAVAVHVLTFLAAVEDDENVTSEMLAGTTNANSVYIRRVLGPLREAGIVTSRPGTQGGWGLARSADTIHLDEVWRAVSGTDPHVMRLHGPNPGCRVGRGIQGVLEGIDADAAGAVQSTLRRRTIADVLVEAGLGAPGGDRRYRSAVSPDGFRGGGVLQRRAAEATGSSESISSSRSVENTPMRASPMP